MRQRAKGRVSVFAEIHDYLVDLPLRLLIQVGRTLPYRSRVAFGGWFMRRIAVGFTDYRQRILKNLALIRPDTSDEESRQIISGCLDNCGRMFAEYYSGRDFIEHVQSITPAGAGLEALKKAHEEGQGVVLATGHFGNFEAARSSVIGQVRRWCAAGITSHSPQRRQMIEQGHIVGGLYRATNNRNYERHHRSAFINVGEPALRKNPSGLRLLVKFVRDGGWMMLAHDQRESSGKILSFMGQPAWTSIAGARIALRQNALLVPFYGIRKPNGLDFEFVVEAPIEHSDEVTMTARLNQSLENMVNAYPAQWFWVHRRWK